MCEIRVTTGASAIHQSINQSGRRLQVTQSINQSINLSVPCHFNHIQSINQPISPVPFQVNPINQSTNHHFKISFLLELSSSRSSDGFCTVLGDKKTNGTVRWGRERGGGGGG